MGAIACSSSSSDPSSAGDGGATAPGSDPSKEDGDGDANAATADAGAATTCEKPRILTPVNGNKIGSKVTATGACAEWLQVRVTEDTSPSAANDPMSVTLTLSSESSIDFDLVVYRGEDADQVECSKFYTKSELEGTTEDTARLQWGKSAGDDDRTLSIEVRPKNPSDCAAATSGAKNWSLVIEGYTF